MWPTTRLTQLLDIRLPIIQAPMAGGPTTPELAASVTAAGGLGSIAGLLLSNDELRRATGAARRLTNGPLNLNFFAHSSPEPDQLGGEEMRRRLTPYYEALGLEPPAGPTLPYRSFDSIRLEAVLDLQPSVVSFQFGLPEESMVRAMKAARIRIIGCATSVAEARVLEDGGADAIVAQGAEAGGHQGTFLKQDHEPIGTMALVPQVVDAVSVPVIAAGGIADGRGIAAALALGADGVQMGTAFLRTHEAGTSAAHRAALAAASGEDTRLTRLFSGRPARAIVNDFMNEMREAEDLSAAFPSQISLLAPLRAAAAAEGRHDYHSLWAGQAVAMGRDLPAAALVEALDREVRHVLSRLS